MKKLLSLFAKVLSVLLVTLGLSACDKQAEVPSTPTVEPNTPSVDVEINAPTETPEDNKQDEVILSEETLKEHLQKHFKVYSTPVEFDYMPPLEDLIVRNAIYFGYDGDFEITEIQLSVSYYDKDFNKLVDIYSKADHIDVTANGVDEVINRL